MTAEVATYQPHGLAVATDQDWWTEKQLASLRQIGVDRASNADLAVFMHVCQRTGLDPFARQIYMILRDGKQTIQTAIDGMRLVARRAVDRTGETLSIGAPEWCGMDGKWRDVWLEPGPPAAARVTVGRGAGTFTAVALWSEYVQTKRDGDVTRMWATRGAGQLAKCAEALALRKACPQDLSGIYTEDELAHTEARPPVAPEDRLAELTADPEPVEGEVVQPMTAKTRAHMFALFADQCITDADEQRRGIGHIIGREVESRGELTEVEAAEVVARLMARKAQEGEA